MSALIRFGESVFPHLLDAAWKATALMAIVFAVTGFLGKRRLTARYWLGVYCLVGMLVMPLISFVAREHRVALFSLRERPELLAHGPGSSRPLAGVLDRPSSRAAADQAFPVEPHVPEAPAEKITAVPPLIVVRASDPAREIARAGNAKTEPTTVRTNRSDSTEPAAEASLPPARPSRSEQAASTGSRFPWQGAIGAAWLVGCSVFLLRLLFAAFSVCRIRRSCSLVSDSRLLELFETSKKTAAVKTRAEIRVGTSLSSPVFIGILRPTVLLPESVALEMAPEQLRPVLVHELAHIRLGDYAINILQRVAESFFFFHPLVWLMSRRLSRLREEICDDWVLDHHPDETLYARALTELAERTLCAKPSRFATLGLFSNCARIRRRIERILSSRDRSAATFRLRTALILLAIILAAVVPLSVTTFSARALGQQDETAAKEGEQPRVGVVSVLEVTILSQPKQVSDIPEYIGQARTEPEGGMRYIVREKAFRDGEPLYTDRTYALAAVPEKYRGLGYVQTANNDKVAQEKFSLVFEVSGPVMVYVAYDDRLEAKPTWLQAFDDTGDNISSDNPSEPVFSVYAKPYPKGKVVLGPNCGVVMSSMYFVVLDELRAPYPKPVVLAASHIIEGEAPLTVQFYGSALLSDGDTKGYTWDFADGTEKSQERNPVHTYSAAGAYLATLTVTDSTGAPPSARVGIRVSAPPAAKTRGEEIVPSALAKAEGRSPAARTGEPAPAGELKMPAEVKVPAEVVVTVTKEGKFIVDRAEKTAEQISEMLKACAKERPGTRAIVKGDVGASWQDVMRVLDACERAGIASISLVAVKTEPNEEPMGEVSLGTLLMQRPVGTAGEAAFVYIQGQVNRPGAYSFSRKDEMTLFRAIAMAGGFTRIANMKKVILMTTDDEGKPIRLEVSVSEIIAGRVPDPQIKPNDRVYVPEAFL